MRTITTISKTPEVHWGHYVECQLRRAVLILLTRGNDREGFQHRHEMTAQTAFSPLLQNKTATPFFRRCMFLLHGKIASQ